MDAIAGTRRKVDLLAFGPKVEELLDAGNGESTLQVYVPDPVIILQGLGNAGIGVLGKGEDARSNVFRLWSMEPGRVPVTCGHAVPNGYHHRGIE